MAKAAVAAAVAAVPRRLPVGGGVGCVVRCVRCVEPPARAEAGPDAPAMAAANDAVDEDVEAPSDAALDCNKRCRQGVKEAYLGCIDEGGEAMTCRVEVGKQVRACKQEQCPEELTEDTRVPDPCKLDCRMDARGVYQSCLDEGGEDDACRSEAAEDARACAADCAD